MADLDKIIKSLELLPEYDGNPHILLRFIKLCDEIVQTYIKINQDDEYINKIVINHILNKITGSVAENFKSNIPEKWDDIKTVLINTFASGRDEASLCIELCHLQQRFEKPDEFYDRCKLLQSAIMTYVNLHDNSEVTIEAKHNLYTKITLQVFLRGLNEPIGSHVRCMRPETIEKALTFVKEELNIINSLNYPTSRFKTRTYEIFSALPPNYTHQNNVFTLPRVPHNFPFPQRPQPSLFGSNSATFGSVASASGFGTSSNVVQNTNAGFGNTNANSGNFGLAFGSFGSSAKNSGLFRAPQPSPTTFGNATTVTPTAGQVTSTGFTYGVKSEDKKGF